MVRTQTRPVRTVSAEPEARSRGRVRCGSCRETTSEGKPFCLRCLSRLPYAALVLSGVQARAEEVARVEAGRRPRASWRIVEDVREALEQEVVATPGRLSDVCGLPRLVVEACLRALRLRSRVRLTRKRTRRGQWFVQASVRT